MYNSDGFNERTIYIKNSVDKRTNLKKVDSSFVKMRVEENKPDVKTVEHNNIVNPEEARGSKDNFVVRNYKINSVNREPESNSVSEAINRARLKKH